MSWSSVNEKNYMVNISYSDNMEIGLIIGRPQNGAKFNAWISDSSMMRKKKKFNMGILIWCFYCKNRNFHQVLPWHHSAVTRNELQTREKVLLGHNWSPERQSSEEEDDQKHPWKGIILIKRLPNGRLTTTVRCPIYTQVPYYALLR